MRRAGDPRRTEAFLLQQDGVLDASCWFGETGLRAHVTPISTHAVCEVELRKACVESLGETGAPESILLVPR